jgi:hypothetical protein
MPLSPLFKRGALGRAALLTLISLPVLLPIRGDARTVSPVENGRYVGPTKRQDVAVRVLCYMGLTVESTKRQDGERLSKIG